MALVESHNGLLLFSRSSKMHSAAELGMNSFCGVVVYRHFGPLFDCRLHVTWSNGSFLQVPVKTTIATQLYDIEKVGAFHSPTP